MKIFAAVSQNSALKVKRLAETYGLKVRILILLRQRKKKLDLRNTLKEGFDWIVFTSGYGAKSFAEAILSEGLFHLLLNTKIAAVGPETYGVLMKFGIGMDFMPEKYTTSALADELPAEGGKRVLTVRSEDGDNELEESLSKRGFLVRRIDAYESVKRKQPIREVSGNDIVIFGSSEIVRTFTDLTKVKPADLYAIPIGPKTLDECKRLGYRVLFVPKVYTYEEIFKELRSLKYGGI
ncbi:MAG: uroporphyrinogen-III synthase [Nitrososphaeria archaeon]